MFTTETVVRANDRPVAMTRTGAGPIHVVMESGAVWRGVYVKGAIEWAEQPPLPRTERSAAVSAKASDAWADEEAQE